MAKSGECGGCTRSFYNNYFSFALVLIYLGNFISLNSDLKFLVILSNFITYKHLSTKEM